MTRKPQTDFAATALERVAPVHARTTLDPRRGFVVPGAFLAELGWCAGDVLVVECDGDSLLIRRAEPAER